MSCKNLRASLISALQANAIGSIEKARMNVEVYLANPVGIGEHSDILSAIQEQLDIMAENDERLQVIEKFFTDPQ